MRLVGVLVVREMTEKERGMSMVFRWGLIGVERDREEGCGSPFFLENEELVLI